MTTRRHVVIGNGGAAVSAIESLRRSAPDDEITSVSREDCPAYSPVLTVYYIAGRIPYRGMFLCGADFYRRLRVTKRWGQAATRVDTARQEVLLADGSTVPYDTLLIATGSTPIKPPIPGADLPGVFTVWTAQDALRLRRALARAQRVAVLGAGMIGLQVINALVSMGKQVVVVELLERPAAQVVDATASALVERRLAQRHTELHFGERLVAITQEGKRKRLSLASGRESVVDAVVLSAGARPNVGLARGSGVAVGQGVLVDETCRTNVGNVFAAGDVAESADHVTGLQAIQPTWPNAIEQGRVAGNNMAGVPVVRLRHCRYNVFTVQGLACASLGAISASGDGWREHITQSPEQYRKLVFRDGNLAGAVLVGDVSEAGVLLSCIERQNSAGESPGGDGGWGAIAAPFAWRWY